MIKVDKLSFSFPQKELYNEVSFTIEPLQHCAFIGTSGSGKSTLVDILMNTEKYKFHGQLEIDPNCRIGYVSQFSQLEKPKETTVYEFIGEDFYRIQSEIASICAEMENSADIEALLARYQLALDAFDSIGGEDFESRVNKKINIADLARLKDLMVSDISGGEFKLVQVVKEMLSCPDLMIMDEPDVFLDFENLNSLKNLINSHKGTLIVITHDRYLLNHCFDKILHLENMEIQEFTGGYIDYNFLLLQTKIELQELAFADDEEIKRNDKLIIKLREIASYNSEASRGKALNARVKVQERLEARKIKAPFVYIKQPEISLENAFEIEDSIALKVNGYGVVFDDAIAMKVDGNDIEVDDDIASKTNGNGVVFDDEIALKANGNCAELQEVIAIKTNGNGAVLEDVLLENVSFEIKSTDKVAIIGPNGTGKTTLLKDIFANNHDSIEVGSRVKMSYLSQFPGDVLNESNTILQEFFDMGFNTCDEIESHVSNYGFEVDMLNQKIGSFSGGEKSMLQLAKISTQKANLLLLDEPTSHLDTYSQIAFEKAMESYTGAVLMISHDFYSIVNCMDYVLIISDKTIRKMSIRKFRKMIYARHFDKDYLEIEKNKKLIETKIELALKENDFVLAKEISLELGDIIKLF
jgi:ATP-binding cassette subfamily F protein 3